MEALTEGYASTISKRERSQTIATEENRIALMNAAQSQNLTMIKMERLHASTVSEMEKMHADQVAEIKNHTTTYYCPNQCLIFVIFLRLYINV